MVVAAATRVAKANNGRGSTGAQLVAGSRTRSDPIRSDRPVSIRLTSGASETSARCLSMCRRGGGGGGARNSNWPRDNRTFGRQCWSVARATLSRRPEPIVSAGARELSRRLRQLEPAADDDDDGGVDVDVDNLLGVSRVLPN